MTVAPHELILGGCKSGKSRTAEARATAWLDGAPGRRATLVATAWAGDDEMAERIAQHRVDRARREPRLQAVEAPQGLGDVLDALAAPEHLLVVDCLTLWLTQCLLPPERQRDAGSAVWVDEERALLAALRRSASPMVMVSNEVGWGVMPMSREARACVDALGRLHRLVAGCCARVTLMVAGCELAVKGGSTR